MTTLHRVSYIDHKGFLNHEWFPTMFTANDRVNELVVLGMESVDFEEVQVPWDHIGDLIHWLNHTPNSPNLKDNAMLNNDADTSYWSNPVPLAADVSPAFATPIPTAPLPWQNVTTTSALDVQVSGDHYKKHGIQPIEYIHANGLPFVEGNVVKYITRWRDKGGIKDLEKIKHYIDLLIELERRKENAS